MTHDALLAKAIERLRSLEARRPDVPKKLSAVTVDGLPKRRVRDAVVIYFEGDGDGGRIQAFMDCESGDMISASYIPAKERSEQ